MNIELVKKKCKKCGNIRKFLKGTPRDKKSICGNCWDWEAEPSLVYLTKEEQEKLRVILSEREIEEFH